MHVLFLSVVAWVTVHELDAVHRAEWRFFFAPFAVGDETAYRVYTALHVPAFLLVFWYLPSTTFRVSFDAFVIVHGVLHLLLRDRPGLDFENWFSGLWIYGAALLGAVHLLTVV